MAAKTTRGVNSRQSDTSRQAIGTPVDVITDGRTVYLVFYEQISPIVTPEISDAKHLQERKQRDNAAAVSRQEVRTATLPADPVVPNEVFGGILTPLVLRGRPREGGSQSA
jgi:hypothetical protein